MYVTYYRYLSPAQIEYGDSKVLFYFGEEMESMLNYRVDFDSIWAVPGTLK